MTPQAPAAYRLTLSDFVMDEIAPGEIFFLRFRVAENGTCKIRSALWPAVIVRAADGSTDTIQDSSYEGGLGFPLACDELRGGWANVVFRGMLPHTSSVWDRIGIWFDQADVKECHWYPLASRLHYRIKPE